MLPRGIMYLAVNGTLMRGLVLLKEPPGLSIGKVRLEDGSEVRGVLGEPILCEGQREITSFGRWRAYVDSSTRAR